MRAGPEISARLTFLIYEYTRTVYARRFRISCTLLYIVPLCHVSIYTIRHSDQSLLVYLFFVYRILQVLICYFCHVLCIYFCIQYLEIIVYFSYTLKILRVCMNRYYTCIRVYDIRHTKIVYRVAISDSNIRYTRNPWGRPRV